MSLSRVLGSVTNPTNQYGEAPEAKIDVLRAADEARICTPAPATETEPDEGDRLTISDEAMEIYSLAMDTVDVTEEAPSVDPSTPVSIDIEFFGLSPNDRILITALERALGIRIRSTDQLKRVGRKHERAAEKMQKAIEDARKQAEAMKRAATAPSKAGWRYLFEREEFDPFDVRTLTVEGLVKTYDGKEVGVQLEVSVATDADESPAKGTLSMLLDFVGKAADIANSSTTFGFDTPSLKGVGVMYTGPATPARRA